ncbi:hypothetical protein DNTS_017901 [Danionella cerebrum]|uniref:Fibronectin type-III domain-containing protein n=1 Tax=Danionella cerebrum TaxID=2873325 RepID=A0A553MS98_9TELE|nr:hypothetical protein DNTS_017901 [Danionella translucida]
MEEMESESDVGFPDPPRNLTAQVSGKEGQLNVSWLPPLLKYMDDSMIYELRYAQEGSHMAKVEETKASTMLVLRGLLPETKYRLWVRVKLDGVSYKGYWSSWTEPVFAVTPPSSAQDVCVVTFGTGMDPLIVVLVIVIVVILCLLSLIVILSHHRFLLKKLWPDIPTPEHKFPGLFTVYKGDFKEWMSQSNGSMWGRSIHTFTEELPSPLEVLSEVSQALGEEQKPLGEEEDEEERSDTDSGLAERWREPPHAQWLMEQLRALQENPESLSQSTLLQSHDTYVTLNQSLSSGKHEEDEVLEETLPLQTLFDSASHSDLGSLQQSVGSGRLSSQSSFEYPNHTWPQKYAYMAVADSGVSMDYSYMSSGRNAEIGKRPAVYSNEYKNEIFGHKWPFSNPHIQPGF